MYTAITFSGAVGNLIGLMRPLVTLIIGLALLYFLWGLVKFISASGDESEVTKGKSAMLWGIIALFIMISIQGIVYLVANSLEIGSGGKPSDTYVEP
jgi:uncharacterized membrane protein